ncbi:MAG: tetratricopeptide repeat protein [Prevotella sp.]|nr:tetratricopeptide repeat protein [Prevotella sp.]
MLLVLIGTDSIFSQTQKEWRDSLSVLNRQIMSSEYSSDLYLRKAAVNLELEQWDYAIETYTDILKREPANPAALFYRAYAQGKMRRYELAANDYRTFLKVAPENVDGMLALAYIYIKQGKNKEAMDNYNRIIEIFPDHSVAYASRASLETTENFLDAALMDWNKAIEFDSKNIDYIVSKADLLIRMNRKSEARRTLDEAVRKGAIRGQLRELYNKTK